MASHSSTLAWKISWTEELDRLQSMGVATSRTRLSDYTSHTSRDFPDSSVGEESACNAEDPGLIPGLGRSAGEGIGYPLQYS